MKLKYGLSLFSLVTALTAASMADAAEITVAVASNFLAPLKGLVADFEERSGHRVHISAGSTGKLYAQIVNGAPYDVFLAANSREPLRLEKEGLGVAGTRFTYALGKLVLWSADATLIHGDGAALLRDGSVTTLAMANPRTAPYGAAAEAVLRALEINTSKLRVVRGENIGQAFQYTASGNVQLGFVALSQVRDPKNSSAGSLWLIPSNLYPPIAQQAVLLSHGKDNEAAKAFLSFIQSKDVKLALVERYGYDVPSVVAATDEH